MAVYFGLLFIVSLLIVCFNQLPERVKLVYGNQKRIVKTDSISFALIFFVLAFFSAIRDGIGSDYDSYLRHIELIQYGENNYMEIGFIKMVELLEKINSDPRFVIIVFSVLTCFFYIKAIYSQSTDVFISIFIFLSWGYYFFTFTTVRNYFALSLVLFSIKYLYEEKHFYFLSGVIIASLFHKSALICIPLYYLARRKYRIKYFLIICVALIGICWVLKSPIRTLMFMVYPQYEGSVYDDGTISYLNVLKALLIIILSILFKKTFLNDDLSRFFFNLNLFSLVFYLGMYWTPEASRIGFYMNATSMFLIPRIVSGIENKKTKSILAMLLCIFSLVLFYMLCISFSSPTIRLLPYETWLF